jgi:hypothetical protein
VLDQYETGRERSVSWSIPLIQIAALWISGVDAIGDDFAIGNAAHAGLVEHPSGMSIEMDTSMPLAIFTDRVEAAAGFGHGRKGLQGVKIAATELKGMAPVLDWAGSAHGFSILDVKRPGST